MNRGFSTFEKFINEDKQLKDIDDEYLVHELREYHKADWVNSKNFLIWLLKNNDIKKNLNISLVLNSK